MLIVCNGIYKSGSTWVFLMLLELFGQKQVPANWRDPNQDDNIDILLAPAEVLNAARSRDLVSKVHSYERDFLSALKTENARIIVTRRDHAAILSSHYHHFSSEKFRLPVPIYALTIGFAKALEVALYEHHATRGDVCDLLIEFNALRADPARVLARIADTFGLEYSTEQIAQAAKAADMRGRDYAERFSAMTGRAWFFRREPDAMKPWHAAVLRGCTAIARNAIGCRPIRAMLVRLFLLDGRRARYARFRRRGGAPAAGFGPVAGPEDCDER